MDKKPVTTTYEYAFAALRNQVNQKILPELPSSNNIRTRIINESGTHGGCRGGRFQGRGVRYQGSGRRGIFGGRGRGRYVCEYGGRVKLRRSRKDDRMVRCNYGS